MKAALRALTMVSAIAVVLFLENCSEDKDPVPAELIVGNWQISTVNITMKVGNQSLFDYMVSQGLSVADAQELVDLFEQDYGGMDGNIEIKKGGTYSSTSGGYTDTGTWELSSDGKTLTFDKNTADAFVVTVSTLTSSSLTLTTDETETDGDLTFSVHLEINLTK